MAKDNCVSCGKGVGKTSHALQCACCAGWIHVGCDCIAEEDFAFMKTRMRYVFRWYCQCCFSSRTGEGAGADIFGDIIKTVTSAMETIHGEIFEQMSRIESRLESSGNAGRPVEPTPETFANIVRQTLQESKKRELNQEEAITVSAFGQTKTVQDRQVLIVIPKSGGRTDSAKLTQATDDVRSALKSIPVDSIRKTNTGSLVVKFPTAEAKSEASDLMSSCYENNDDFVVSQPKKMLPKMTLTGIPSSFPEGEIIDGILSKNKKIKNLCEEGLPLSLLFVKQKDQNEHKVAVLKMAPEIRKAVNETGGYVYLGLSRCRAYDRFWVTQCFHCQKFCHIATKCPSKKEAPVCVYCAGHYKSSVCSDKSYPKCANCSARAALDVSCSHYASSPNCPMMALQRKMVIEGSDLVSSKNL